MSRIITENNWLETTMNALEELDNFYLVEYQRNKDKDILGKLDELQALITYLNKTN